MRAEQVPAGFSLGRQIARTAALAALILAGALLLARGASPWAWLLLPGVWVFANFFEWTVHRFPMHRPLRPRVMFRNHAQIHHGAFTEASMAVDSGRELSLVMMPWYTILMLFVAASPVAALVGVVGGRALAGVFYVGAVTYFLFYETMHALYHLPDRQVGWLGLRRAAAVDGGDAGGAAGVFGARGLFARLRAHHAWHHVHRRMGHANFNVTVPLADWILGTREQPAGRAASPVAGSESAAPSESAAAAGSGGSV